MTETFLFFFLNVKSNILTETLATWICEIVPILTQKSETTLMKCNLQPSVLRMDFPLVHRAQLTVRSAWLYFAEKAGDVGGVFYIENILRKVKQLTLIFLNCSPDSKH